MSIRRILTLALLCLSLFAVAAVVKAQVFEMPSPLPEPGLYPAPISDSVSKLTKKARLSASWWYAWTASG